jgi:DNA-binding transcriptional regulator LsrR (DeoR family)
MKEKLRLMIKIAKLYYESGLTQDAISQRLRLSRPRVSRLMQEALDQGIVRISIPQEPGSYAELEQQVETRFGLLEAIIADVTDLSKSETVSRDLGIAAAGQFGRLVQDGDIVGLTWGVTLASMVENLQPEKKRNSMVVQMVGGLGEPQAETHATGLVSRTSTAIGASLWLLPAPGVVGSAEFAALLRSDRHISQTLEMVKKANIAFVGVGAPTRGSLLMRDESIISWQEMEKLIDFGAVGDIGLHFYDIQGNLVKTELDERVIGISLEEMRMLSRVVGIAGGPEKFNAILGAIRGRFINTLVTDPATARKLLELQT